MNQSELQAKWVNMPWQKLRARAAEFVEDHRQADAYINLMVSAAEDKVAAFFKMGFVCQRCQDSCCERETKDGIALVGKDLEKLAAHLGISKGEFKRRYTFTKDTGRFLNYPCPFFVKEGQSPRCQVVNSWPTVCRLYPVNRPDNMLTCNSHCPEGRRIATEIIKYQAGVLASREKP